jgi:predicted  nucleic acid-binding Zn-ribbon protein
MNWILYGLGFVAYGIYRKWRDAKAANEVHAHTCWQCGATWRHDGTRPDDVAAHTCPRCGVQQWLGYVEPDEKVPLKTGGVAQQPAVSSLTAPTGSPPAAGGLRPERPAPSPKDRDTADHGAGPALPPEKKPS